MAQALVLPRRLCAAQSLTFTRRVARHASLLMLALVCGGALWAPAAALAQTDASASYAAPKVDPWAKEQSDAFNARLNDPAISALPAADGKLKWFDGMPWPGVAAYNTTVSEAVGATCAFDSEGAETLGQLTEALRSDQASIDKAHGKAKQEIRPFGVYYARRLNGETGAPNAVGAVKGVNQLDMSLLPTRPADFAEYTRALLSSPDTGGCESKSGIGKLSKIISATTPQLSEILFSPLTLVLKLPFAALGLIGAAGYAMVGDTALSWSLTTPHSERGDTIWSGSAEDDQGGETGGAVSCQHRASEMGFDCDHIGLKGQQSEPAPWLRLANSLRSGTSVIFGLAALSAILVFMFRRREGGLLDAKRTLPRVAGSALLSGAAPYLIGTAITFSNFTTKGLLELAPGSPSEQILNALLNVSDFRASGVLGALPTIITQPLSLILTSVGLFVAAAQLWFLAIFAVATQLAFIFLLVMTAPAIAAMIFEKSTHWFAFWARGLIAILLLPVAQAAVLVFTTQIADALASHDGLSAKAIIGLVVLLTGLRTIVKANHMARGYVTGGFSRAVGHRVMGAAAQVGGIAATAATGNPLWAKAGGTVGTSLKQSSETAHKGWAERGARMPAPLPVGGRSNPFARTNNGNRGQISDTADELYRDYRKSDANTKKAARAKQRAMDEIARRQETTTGKHGGFDFDQDGFAGADHRALGVDTDGARRAVTDAAGGGMLGLAAGVVGARVVERGEGAVESETWATIVSRSQARLTAAETRHKELDARIAEADAQHEAAVQREIARSTAELQRSRQAARIRGERVEPMPTQQQLARDARAVVDPERPPWRAELVTERQAQKQTIDRERGALADYAARGRVPTPAAATLTGDRTRAGAGRVATPPPSRSGVA